MISQEIIPQKGNLMLLHFKAMVRFSVRMTEFCDVSWAACKERNYNKWKGRNE